MGFESPFAAPSATNVYVPNDALAKMITVDFTRNPDDFTINRYTQVIGNLPTKTGYYKRLQPDQNARVRDTTFSLWPDGQPAPSGAWNKKLFTNIFYETQRRVWPWEEGEQTIDQSTIDWEVTYANMVGQQSMTEQTELVIAALEAASWGTNQIDVGLYLNTELSTTGAYLDNGKDSEPHIKRVFGAAEVAIKLGTYSALKPSDLLFVCNPNTAFRLGLSQEIHSYLGRSQWSMDVLTGQTSQGIRDLFGLPPILYGHEVVVEDAAYEPTQPGETRAPSFVLPDNVAYFVSRKGGLKGLAGRGTFSTVVRLFYGAENNYESRYDSWNKLYQGRTWYDSQVQVSSTLTGVRMVNLFAP